MNILRPVLDGKGGHYGVAFHCPGCDVEHIVTTLPYPGGWTFEGTVDAPTLSPSILVYASRILDDDDKPRDTPRCHSFVRAGHIEFQADSTHALAGKTVPLPEIER